MGFLSVIVLYMLILQALFAVVYIQDQKAFSNPAKWPPYPYENVAITLGVISTLHILYAALLRCHDRNKSGFFLLIFLVPFIGPVWLFVELFFLRSKQVSLTSVTQEMSSSDGGAA